MGTRKLLIFVIFTVSVLLLYLHYTESQKATVIDNKVPFKPKPPLPRTNDPLSNSSSNIVSVVDSDHNEKEELDPLVPPPKTSKNQRIDWFRRKLPELEILNSTTKARDSMDEYWTCTRKIAQLSSLWFGFHRQNPLDQEIFSPDAFYPVNWIEIPRLFKKPETTREAKWVEKTVQDMSKGSYMIHLWNKVTRKIKIEEGSVMQSLISTHCTVCGNITNSHA